LTQKWVDNSAFLSVYVCVNNKSALNCNLTGSQWYHLTNLSHLQQERSHGIATGEILQPISCRCVGWNWYLKD